MIDINGTARRYGYGLENKKNLERALGFKYPKENKDLLKAIVDLFQSDIYNEMLKEEDFSQDKIDFFANKAQEKYSITYTIAIEAIKAWVLVIEEENNKWKQIKKERDITAKEKLKKLSYDQLKYVNVNSNVEDIVKFGDLIWVVLKKDESSIMLLTRDIIELRAYNEQKCDVTWETCTLRQYLNNEFLYKHFSKKEISVIKTTKVINNRRHISHWGNKEYETFGGNDTLDRLFLLSLEEANSLLESSVFLRANYNKTPFIWWVRIPAFYQDEATYIERDDFNIYVPFCYSVNLENGVRPALNLKLQGLSLFHQQS